ncbi:hypothetical protein [Flavobacterium wongokense]|uniref:hypothetical protein n=1 Tax=Flavobacterium wongokense TaxID=2910674 RepID=UPI001F239972|nr:hypothetical protein [Flavobacterium sp. WG47]MCF6131844.1 hypothetical protein [Flavobacterium sp. WG47]
MKKIFLFLCVGLLTVNGFGQKKKAGAKKTATTVAALPKLDNLQVEVKNGKFQIIVSEKGKTNDMLVVKDVDAGFAPKDCKLSSFIASGVKLYLLTWTELSVTKSTNKTEEKTTIYSVIYELTSKKQVYSNYQLTNHITEVVSLGGTAATETQEKMRREGFEFILNPDGSVTQKGKNQQMTFVYDKDKMEFKKK